MIKGKVAARVGAVFVSWVLIVSAAQFSGAGGCGTTDTGDDGGGETTAVSQLVDAICTKIIECEPTVSATDCETALLATNQLDGDFGLEEGGMTMQEISDQVDAGTVSVNDANLTQCLTDLDALTCEEVAFGFDSGSPDNFENVENFIPETANSCNSVFAL